MSAQERLLCQVWADMLGVEAVGPHDDFYALGGHSLLAMRISARLRHEHGIDLRVSHILERPTVAELAELVSAQPPQSHRGCPS
jgi:aryl carrier-like protein